MAADAAILTFLYYLFSFHYYIFQSVLNDLLEIIKLK